MSDDPSQAVQDLVTRVTTLEGTVATTVGEVAVMFPGWDPMKTRVESHETRIANLEQQISDLKAAVDDLASKIPGSS